MIEVPHQASLHNGEREVYVLRSDSGQTWNEHPTVSSSTDVNEALDGCFQGDLTSSTLHTLTFFCLQFTNFRALHSLSSLLFLMIFVLLTLNILPDAIDRSASFTYGSGRLSIWVFLGSDNDSVKQTCIYYKAFCGELCSTMWWPPFTPKVTPTPITAGTPYDSMH